MRISLLTIASSLIVGLLLIPRAVETVRKARAERAKIEKPPPDVVEIIDLRPEDGPPKWIDAARSAGLRSGMHVKITRCEFGTVAGRDANNEVIAASPGEFLKVYLRVTNRQKTKARYISWYGNSFRDGNHQVAALLLDDTGREYPPQRFSGLRSIEGHVDNVTLESGESTGDVLIFALPAAKAAGEVTLRLQLPAAAVARTGSFDFKLSRELWER